MKFKLLVDKEGASEERCSKEGDGRRWLTGYGDKIDSYIILVKYKNGKKSNEKLKTSKQASD